MVELSVIIPTYNRADRLRACLEALSQQTQPPADFEVIVVVDGSTDGTHEMLANLIAPYQLGVICQQHRGRCSARNRGVAAAIGRYCLFLDDDMIAAPSLVAEHLRVQREREGIIAIGRIMQALPPHADWFARSFAQVWNDHYARLNQGIRSPSWTDCYSGNMSVPRAVFLSIDGFTVDLPYSEDVELGYRLERQGLSVVYVPDALGEHHDDKNFHALAADAEKAGAACAGLCRRYPPMLPQLLGTFGEANRREILLRRILLALDISPRFLALIGPLLGKRWWTYAWSRFLHRYCYWRGVRRTMPDRDTWRRLIHGTTILMYHAFGAPGEPASRYVIPKRRFARQMAWLKWMGYRLLSLEEFLRYRIENRLPPARSVVITIDDGYKDNVKLAYPILRRHGIPATIFLVSNQLGGTYHSQVQSEVNGRPMLSWEDTKEMMKGGIKFGAHTRTHPHLTTISLQEAQQEIHGSKVDLERELGIPVCLFSYPFGEYDAKVQSLVQQAGFLGSCSVKTGLNTPMTPLQALRRVEIYGTDSLLDFALAVWSGERANILWKRLSLLVAQLLDFGLADKMRNLMGGKRSRPHTRENIARPGRQETLGKRL